MTSSHIYRCVLPLVAASALVAAPAPATPGSGFAPTPISNGHFGDLDVKAQKTGDWDLLLKTKDNTDVAVDRLVVQPGGQSGWHFHPAPIFVTVLAGPIQWYDSQLCAARTYNTADAFIEPAYAVHLVRNTGAAVAEFTAVRVAPTGVPVRQDAPEPNNC